MLPFRVDFHSGEPVYEQVMFAAKKAILSGHLSAGARFPSVRSLSQELKINPNTAHKVVQALTVEGFLTVQPGVGTVVAPPVSGSADERSQLLSRDAERLVIEASRLGLSEDQLLAAVRKHWRKISPPCMNAIECSRWPRTTSSFPSTRRHPADSRPPNSPLPSAFSFR